MQAGLTDHVWELEAEGQKAINNGATKRRKYRTKNDPPNTMSGLDLAAAPQGVHIGRLYGCVF
jgi:hypothetical protein